MTRLPNFPHKDQRTEGTKDGRPPENGNYDCVPTSFACAIQYLTGQNVSGDELKDYEYGDGYHGGTALARYVDDASDWARKNYRVTAEPFTSNDPRALVAKVHEWIKAGYPVIATIPSAWGKTAAELGVTNRATQSGNISSHVLVFFGEDPNQLTGMNPWGAFDHAGSDQYWADRFLFTQVWKVRKETVAISTKGLGAGFAKYVNEKNVAAKNVSGGEVYKGDWSYATFENGLILFYSAATGVRDNMGHEVIDRLNAEINVGNAAVKDRDLKITGLNQKLSTEEQALTQAKADLAKCVAEPKGLSDAQKQALGVAAKSLKPLADAFNTLDAAVKSA